LDRKLENAWAIMQPQHGYLGAKLIPRPPPETQEQFCQDNMDSTVPYTKLILRGMIDPAFRVEGSCIWYKRRWLTDDAVWEPECDVYPTDLVVHMLGLDGVRTRAGCWQNDGLWLLRLAGDDEFKLIGCLLLPFHSGHLPPLYSNWKWNPGYFREAPSQAQLVDHCRRFATDSKISHRPCPPGFYTKGSKEVRKFTII
jgi:hypothetical protein